MLGAAAVAPLFAGDLLHLGGRPGRLDTLGVVPDVHEAVQLQRIVRLHSRHVWNYMETNIP